MLYAKPAVRGGRSLGPIMPRNDSSTPTAGADAGGPPPARIELSYVQPRPADLDAAHRDPLAGLGRCLERIERASARVTAALTTLPVSDLRPLYQVIVDQARLLAEAALAALGFGGIRGRTFDPWVISGASPGRAASGGAPRGTGLLGAVIRTGRAIRVTRVSGPAWFSDPPAPQLRVTSFLGVPIRYQGDRGAALFLANKLDGGAFSDEDQLLMAAFAERVRAVLEIARLRQVEARDRARLELLARIGARLAAPIESEVAVDAVARLVVPALADLSAVGLVQPDGSVTGIAAYHPAPAGQQLLDRLLGTAARDQLPDELRAAIATAQPRLCDRWSGWLPGRATAAEHRRLADGLGATCAILAPVVVRDRVAGVLQLAMAGSGRRYLPGDLALAGEIAGYAALAIERGRLDRAARAAIQARDDLLAFATHDLHNDLATIRMTAASLSALDTAPERPGGHRQLDLIARTAAHMARRIDDLRGAAAVETGHALRTAPEDIAALVAEAVDTLAPQAEARSLRITARVDSELPAVSCDRERVLQVIANLVGNAIKFTPAGGDIRIAAARGEEAVKISIADTGPGIAAPELPHVFDRHWTGGETAAGTGLGLFIARSIVEAHGGRIWAESAIGAGTAFHFTLPLVPAASPRAGPHPSPGVRRHG